MSKVLVACEKSGVVRDAFRAAGHDAWSADYDKDETDSEFHYVGNVLNIVEEGWDLMIAHPPCTYLANSGNQWLSHPDDFYLPFDERREHPMYPGRRQKMYESVAFAIALFSADIKHICIENPVGMLSTIWRKPDQTIQPYQFGHQVSKKTCFWLKNLPPLIPTNEVPAGDFVTFSSGARLHKWYHEGRKKTKDATSTHRSKTFTGIAEAMADQWSYVI